MPQLTYVDYSNNPVTPPFKPKSLIVELAMVEANLKHVWPKLSVPTSKTFGPINFHGQSL